MVDKEVIFEDNAKFNDEMFVERFFHFKLLDKLYLGGIDVNSSDIKLEFDPADKNYLISFTIKGKTDDANQAREIAIQEATKLTNLLSAVTNQFVYHNKPDVSTLKNGEIGIEHLLSEEANVVCLPTRLNLSDDKIYSLLTENRKLNRQLDHFANGLKAQQDGNYDEAIRRFFQALEPDLPSHLSKYNHLRNGLSHLELHQDTVNALKNQFQIDCTINQETNKSSLDTTSLIIRERLKIHARILRNEAWKLLDKKIPL